MQLAAQRMRQVLIEDKYSRKNIRKMAYDDILSSAFGALEKPFLEGSEIVKQYLNKRYSYESKNLRVKTLKRNVVPLDIVIETFVSIFSSPHPTPIQAIAGNLGNVFGFSNVLDGVKTSSEIVALLECTGAYQIVCASDSETGSILVRSNFLFSPKTLEYIEQAKYLPPLVCPPLPLTSNRASGYLTHDDSVILGRGNHHDGCQSLDVLNILNAIPLQLDTDMLAHEELLKPADPNMSHLAKHDRLENHQKMVAASKIVYEELIEEGGRFFFNWKNDTRGRIYSQGYHVNIQSTDFKKSLISLNETYLITGD